MAVSEPSARLLNLLGAFALALSDEMRVATEAESAMAAGAPSALTSVLASPGLSLDMLRKTLGLTPSGAGRLIDRLAAAGLIERRTGTVDQRFVAIHLTKRGVRVAERVLAARRSAVSRVLAPLTRHELGVIERAADKMLSAITTDRERCDYICRLCERSACPPDLCPIETLAIDLEKRQDA